ncbi:MAG: hypothetical protein GDA51_13405, partial [Ekhidna sp.]|nr:hypothetical protein [Ekhidna sp.]
AVSGINVNVKNDNGNTALIWATFNDHATIVKALLNVDGILVNIIGSRNRTALDWANGLPSSTANTAITTALRNAGAKTKAELDSE